MKEASDIKQATETVESIRARQRDLEEQVVQETARITAGYDSPLTFDTLAVAPKRGQVSIQFVALGWIPDASR
jgi:hypothetical protein